MVLKRLWQLSDYICGKRLSEYIKETLPILERFKEINLDETAGEIVEAIQ